MNELLKKIIENKTSEIAFRKSIVSLKEMKQRAADAEPARAFAGAIKSSGRRRKVIAEVKRISPGSGFCRKEFDPAQIAIGYEAAGAAALSVLTDTVYFGGSAHCLSLAKSAVNLPVLRKDFILDLYQVYEARAIGADAVLLMAINFESKNKIDEFAGVARGIGLELIFEIHDEKDIDLVPASACVGVNNRDFRDEKLKVDVDVTRKLAPLIKNAPLLVSESGISGAKTMDELESAGADAFLIGTALMKEDDPGIALARLLG
ncbi:MAG: indole-3-glycerol-phosphate synthase [Nitrospinota bacterium]